MVIESFLALPSLLVFLRGAMRVFWSMLSYTLQVPYVLTQSGKKPVQVRQTVFPMVELTLSQRG
jgi:hypothetical protein